MQSNIPHPHSVLPDTDHSDIQAKGMPPGSYEGVSGEAFVPYVSTLEALPELTGRAIALGALFAAVFALANVYLGLQVGMTIAAGIPAAILAVGLLKMLSNRNSMLEANMVQSIASMGESLAGGLIFTIPAIFIWQSQGLDASASFWQIVMIQIVGGALGIFLITPIRRSLVVQEHSKLTYPESMAISEMLVSAHEGGKGLKTLISGIGFGFIFKFLSGGMGIWQDGPTWIIKSLGSLFGISAVVSTAGIGFIIGLQTGMSMFAGSVITWYVLVPLITYLGSFVPEAIYPATVPIAELGPMDIWGNYVRYIGAGAVAAGGFLSLLQSLPSLVRSFAQTMGSMKGKGGDLTRLRYDQDTPMSWVIGICAATFMLAWLLPLAGNVGSMGFVAAALAVFFSFFFGIVSGRMVGVVGVSSNPVSGMTIAALLVISAVLKTLGYVGTPGMMMSIVAAGVVCVAASTAGGQIQAQKAGFIVGGTPKKIQLGMMIGVVIAAFATTAVLFMLESTYGLGSSDVPAPQAMLMALVLQGVMTAKLPWVFVISGLFLGLVFRMMKLPVLMVALGVYLPIHLTASILFGGLIRAAVDYTFRKDKATQQEKADKGILLASGLVAGDALTGVLIAALATLGIGINISGLVPFLSGSASFAGLIYCLFGFWFYTKVRKNEEG